MPCSHLNVANQAMTWVSKRWRHQGRTRHGIDCIGLIIMVARELGLSEFDTHAYERSPDGVEFMAGFKEQMDYVRPGRDQQGDVIVLRDQVLPCHCGIFVEYRGVRHVVHAAARHRRVIVQPFVGEFVSNRIAVFSYRGLVD